MEEHNRTFWFFAKNGKLEKLQQLHQENRGRINGNWRNPSFLNQTALIRAARSGHHETVKWLLENAEANVHEQDKYERTALHWASYNGHKETVQVLLNHDSSIDNQDSSQSTALMLAAANGYDIVVKCLLQNGAKIDAKNRIGRTALIDAARLGYKTAVQVLLDHGADPSLKGSQGYTAVEWAGENGEAECVLIIKQRMITQGYAIKSSTIASSHAMRNLQPPRVTIYESKDSGQTRPSSNKPIGVLDSHWEPKVSSTLSSKKTGSNPGAACGTRSNSHLHSGIRNQELPGKREPKVPNANIIIATSSASDNRLEVASSSSSSLQPVHISEDCKVSRSKFVSKSQEGLNSAKDVAKNSIENFARSCSGLFEKVREKSELSRERKTESSSDPTALESHPAMDLASAASVGVECVEGIAEGFAPAKACLSIIKQIIDHYNTVQNNIQCFRLLIAEIEKYNDIIRSNMQRFITANQAKHSRPNNASLVSKCFETIQLQLEAAWELVKSYAGKGWLSKLRRFIHAKKYYKDVQEVFYGLEKSRQELGSSVGLHTSEEVSNIAEMQKAIQEDVRRMLIELETIQSYRFSQINGTGTQKSKLEIETELREIDTAVSSNEIPIHNQIVFSDSSWVGRRRNE